MSNPNNLTRSDFTQKLYLGKYQYNLEHLGYEIQIDEIAKDNYSIFWKRKGSDFCFEMFRENGLTLAIRKATLLRTKINKIVNKDKPVVRPLVEEDFKIQIKEGKRNFIYVWNYNVLKISEEVKGRQVYTAYYRHNRKRGSSYILGTTHSFHLALEIVNKKFKELLKIT